MTGQALQMEGLVRVGKGTRRSRCAECHALVLTEALDDRGRCSSCAAQTGLFPLRRLPRRRIRTQQEGSQR